MTGATRTCRGVSRATGVESAADVNTKAHYKDYYNYKESGYTQRNCPVCFDQCNVRQTKRSVLFETT